MECGGLSFYESQPLLCLLFFFSRFSVVSITQGTYGTQCIYLSC